MNALVHGCQERATTKIAILQAYVYFQQQDLVGESLFCFLQHLKSSSNSNDQGSQLHYLA